MRGGGREVNRRIALKTGAALMLGFCLPARGQQKAAAGGVNAWISIAPDDIITLFAETPEVGQGTRTANAMMLAEELEADWAKVRVEQAPTVPAVYKHLGTGGSGGTWNTWMPLRQAGAQAREMLLRAAARQFSAPKQECRAGKSVVVHLPTGRRLRYGELVEAAQQIDPPDLEQVPLKDPKDFRIIGQAIPRVDVPSKTDGSAIFGVDARVPGMLYAVIARCPHFGGTLASFDAAAALKVPGVRRAFAVARLHQPGSDNRTVGGVAIVADSTWAALQGRKALKVAWSRDPAGDENSVGLQRRFDAALDSEPMLIAVNQGDALGALDSPGKKLEAYYEVPFQAHAPMEPMNTTVHVKEGSIEAWSPNQHADTALKAMAELAGLSPDRVTIHTTLSGGSFGRRTHWDFSAEAWQVANEMRVPVQLLWTREDDLQHDFLRPFFAEHLSANINASGEIQAWRHRIVSTSVHAYFNWGGKSPDPAFLAGLELNRADNLFYRAANTRLEYTPVSSAAPRAWLRSVDTAPNAFASESFMDELAHAAGIDPLQYRLQLLRDDRPDDTRRMRAVLQLAAEKSGWGKPLPKGHGRGIACYIFTFGYVAEVAQVSVDADGKLRVHRVVGAVHCGMPVNPESVRSQIESGINYALTTVLSGEITIENGGVKQSNFHDYRVLRMSEAPEIEVQIVPTTEPPERGVGEGGVPPLAPAVANAIFAATGKRIRRFPVAKIV